MKFPFFPFYPQDWLSDPKVTQLNYEEQGIYFRMLCLMWALDDSCSIPDDDKFICRILSLTPGRWKKVRKILIDGHLPVFFIKNGKIFNKRLLEEKIRLEKKSEINSENSKKRWENFNHKPLNNNNRGYATASFSHGGSDNQSESDKEAEDMPKVSLSESESESESYIEDISSTKTADKDVVAEKKSPRKKPLTDIPENFCLTESMIAYAEKKGISDVGWLESFTERFVLKCEAKGYRYVRWEKAWQDWLRGSIEQGEAPTDSAQTDTTNAGPGNPSRSSYAGDRNRHENYNRSDTRKLSAVDQAAESRRRYERANGIDPDREAGAVIDITDRCVRIV